MCLENTQSCSFNAFLIFRQQVGNVDAVLSYFRSSDHSSSPLLPPQPPGTGPLLTFTPRPEERGLPSPPLCSLVSLNTVGIPLYPQPLHPGALYCSGQIKSPPLFLSFSICSERGVLL